MSTDFGRVVLRDLGFDEYMKDVLELESLMVKAGFPEKGKISEPVSAGSGHAPVDTISEMIIIASAHEFGLGVPERSFIRSAVDENMSKIEKQKEIIYERVALGKMTAKQGMDALGSFLVGIVRRKLTQLKTPQNADSTRKAKGSSNPLIDSGQMRQTIQFVTVGKNA